MFGLNKKNKLKSELKTKVNSFLRELKLNDISLSHDNIKGIYESAINITADSVGNPYDAVLIYFMMILESDAIERDLDKETSTMLMLLIEKIYQENKSLNGLAFSGKFAMLKSIYSNSGEKETILPYGDI